MRGKQDGSKGALRDKVRMTKYPSPKEIRNPNDETESTEGGCASNGHLLYTLTLTLSLYTYSEHLLHTRTPRRWGDEGGGIRIFRRKMI